MIDDINLYSLEKNRKRKQLLKQLNCLLWVYFWERLGQN